MQSRPYTFETGADLEVFRTIPLILTTLQGKKRNRITVMGSRCHSPRTRPPRTAERLRPCWQEALCDGSGARTEQSRLLGAGAWQTPACRCPLPARKAADPGEIRARTVRGAAASPPRGRETHPPVPPAPPAAPRRAALPAITSGDWKNSSGCR